MLSHVAIRDINACNANEVQQYYVKLSFHLSDWEIRNGVVDFVAYVTHYLLTYALQNEQSTNSKQ